jgi:hypothetical protein
MKYTVVWAAEAEEDLARLWLDSTDRDVITRTAFEIEAELSSDPSEVGESRVPDRRICILAPLGVVFEVRSNDRIVRIMQVWRFDKRPRE